MGSPLDGFGGPEDVIKRASDLKRSAIAITEHDNLFSAPYFEDAARKAKLKMIFGAELRLVGSIERNKQRKHHYTVLAKSVEGYQNLCALVSTAWHEGFYYLPTTDWKMLRKYSKDLIVLSGCNSGLIQRFLENNDFDNALLVAKKYKDIFGDNFYIEVMPIGEHLYDHTKAVVPGLIRIADKIDARVVLTNDVHMLDEKGSGLWRVLSSIKRRQTWEESSKMVKSCHQQDDVFAFIHAKNVLGGLMSKNEIKRSFENQDRIASDIDSVEIPKSGTPEFAPEKKSMKILRSLVYKELDRRGLSDNKEYLDRANSELALIKTKEFANYMLVVWDIIKWARKNDIMVGPGRGSSSGSLVCWLTGITSPDPIKMGLSFERFISIDRKDLPDIDIDFEDEHRDDVIGYMANRYGEDKVGTLITFHHFATRGVIQDIGRVFGIPLDQLEIISKMAVYRSTADARSSLSIREMAEEFPIANKVFKEYPALRKAFDLEGQVRHYGRNAAGVLISSRPISEFAPIVKMNDVEVAGVDIEGAKFLGALKMDILGIRTLTMLKSILDAKGKTEKWLYDLPLDDAKTLEIFRSAKTKGIFQFEANATHSLLSQITVTKFNDIVAITSLSRPGPLHSGTTQRYKELASQGKRFRWKLEKINEITRESKGLIIYQEQVMRICKDVGEMEWDDVSAVRSAMSKSLGTEYFDGYREKFRPGAKRNGLSDSEIDRLWDALCSYGSWAFNKSHAVAYGLLSYYCAYMKAHWPRTFYMTVCNYEGDGEKLNGLLREYIERGLGKVLPPKINVSEIGFKLEGNDIRSGYTHVPKVGEKASAEIKRLCSEFKIKTAEDLQNNVEDKRIINSRVMGAVREWGLFDDSDKDIFGLYTFRERLERTPRTDKIGDLGYSFQMRRVKLAGVLIGGSGGSSVSHINLKSVQEVVDTVRMSGQVQKRFDEEDRILDKWCIMQLMDDTGNIQLHVKPKEFKVYGEMLYTLNPNTDLLIIDGIMPPSRGHIVVKNIEKFDDTKLPGGLCFRCSLYEAGCVAGSHKNMNHRPIMVIAEAPGYNEIESGKPLVGQAGQAYAECVVEAGLDRNKDIEENHAVACRPTDEEGKNRKPTQDEIDNCNERLKLAIDKIKPDVIITLGDTAYKAVTRDNGAKISDLVGDEVKHNGYVILPTYHPATMMYSNGKTKGEIVSALKRAKEIAGV